MLRAIPTFIASGVVLGFSLIQPDATRADDNDCFIKSGDVKIKACTRIINSKRLFGKPISENHLAPAYVNRGYAYYKRGLVKYYKGIFFRAIADYDKAI